MVFSPLAAPCRWCAGTLLVQAVRFSGATSVSCLVKADNSQLATTKIMFKASSQTFELRCHHEIKPCYKYWQEEAAMDDFAENYDAVLVPGIFRPWAREMIGRVPPLNGIHILDLACGTVAVTREVVATGVSAASLTGVDLTPAMLNVARKRAAAAGITADWVEANAEALPFGESSFDLAYCQHALQFFPNPTHALKELRRVLRDGSSVAFCVSTGIDENPMLQSQAATMEKHIGKLAGNSVRAICRLSDADQIFEFFEDAGFGAINIEKVTLTLMHPDARASAAGAMGGMHTEDKLAELNSEQRDACFRDFLDGLGTFFDGQAMTFPHVSNVVTALSRVSAPSPNWPPRTAPAAAASSVLQGAGVIDCRERSPPMSARTAGPELARGVFRCIAGRRQGAGSSTGRSNPPSRRPSSGLRRAVGSAWRPADQPTTGVERCPGPATMAA